MSPWGANTNEEVVFHVFHCFSEHLFIILDLFHSLDLRVFMNQLHFLLSEVIFGRALAAILFR